MKRAKHEMSLAEALRAIRDPGGDGKTRVSHGFTGQPMKCVRCGRPTKEQAADVIVAEAAPRCACG